ncbi:hypothetical protein EAG_02228 [Camponotus floridanus]|uniref:Uncharacterized protein n=1 Tax=Camponotus floridanus TaxID=104421 RepID=E2AD04_CAMFO|nr:hypothetical protein EAG_02228 [Camponotus floridanus]
MESDFRRDAADEKADEESGRCREKARLGLTSSYASSAAGSECQRRVAAFAQPLNAFTRENLDAFLQSR